MKNLLLNNPIDLEKKFKIDLHHAMDMGHTNEALAMCMDTEMKELAFRALLEMDDERCAFIRQLLWRIDSFHALDKEEQFANCLLNPEDVHGLIISENVKGKSATIGVYDDIETHPFRIGDKVRVLESARPWIEKSHWHHMLPIIGEEYHVKRYKPESLYGRPAVKLSCGWEVLCEYCELVERGPAPTKKLTVYDFKKGMTVRIKDTDEVRDFIQKELGCSSKPLVGAGATVEFTDPDPNDSLEIFVELTDRNFSARSIWFPVYCLEIVDGK